MIDGDSAPMGPVDGVTEAQPIRIRFRPVVSTLFTLLAVALLAVPVAGALVSVQRGDRQADAILGIGLLIFGLPAVWFAYFGLRGLVRRGEQLVVGPDGLTGPLLPQGPPLPWAGISTARLESQGGYVRLILTLRSGEEVVIRDIGTLSPSLPKVFSLIKHRLETGVFAFPPRVPWWQGETAIMLAALVFIVVVLAVIVVVAKN